MNSRQVFDELMRLPEQSSNIVGPSHTRTSNFLRKVFYGTPRGKRFYFYMNRPMLRDKNLVTVGYICNTLTTNVKI